MNNPNVGRAWTWTQLGGPDSLKMETRSVSLPGAGEVLIANRAIGLNPVDWKVIEGGHEAWRPGHVPGVDGAGIIVALGKGVRLPLGTRIAYHQSLARDGSFAEFTCVNSQALLLIPDGLDNVSAAALPCPSLTAWQAVAKVSGGPGKDVLVTGAGGTVGLLLAQRCIERGWRVWATAASRHHGALKDIGVIAAFDYRDEAWTTSLTEALGPRRLYAIIDTVGSEAARLMAPMTGYNGHLVHIMYREEVLPLPIFTKALSVHEVALNSIHDRGSSADWREWRAMGEQLFARAETGQVRLPTIITLAWSSSARMTVRRCGCKRRYGSLTGRNSGRRRIRDR